MDQGWRRWGTAGYRMWGGRCGSGWVLMGKQSRQARLFGGGSPPSQERAAHYFNECVMAIYSQPHKKPLRIKQHPTSASTATKTFGMDMIGTGKQNITSRNSTATHARLWAHACQPGTPSHWTSQAFPNMHGTLKKAPTQPYAKLMQSA
jgi:hypothetical protein